jgi:UDP-N-acetylglucosamine 2-epimerase (non-hydrolysing)
MSRADATPAAPAAAPVVVLSVVGARPNFMKVAPIVRCLHGRPGWRHALVHTGQHYDANMSEVFFAELGIPAPDIHLGVGSGTHAEQTARVMLALEGVLLREKPDVVVVVGDVNSTLAASLVAVKLRIPVAHVEAGLRSYDRDMPEEINRLLTDAIVDLLLTPSPDADANLRREGVDPSRIHFVGNIMIDTLLQTLPRARAARAWERFGFERRGYGVVTLHRPSNVDERATLTALLDLLERIAGRLPIVFPMHPRTRRMLQEFGIELERPGVRIVDPIGYVDFLSLEEGARLALTDSGGVQEETTVLGVPCLTLRANTERPVTVTAGTNRVVGQDPEAIWAAVNAILDRPMPAPSPPEKWDGRTAERIVRVIEEFVAARRASPA